MCSQVMSIDYNASSGNASIISGRRLRMPDVMTNWFGAPCDQLNTSGQRTSSSEDQDDATTFLFVLNGVVAPILFGLITFTGVAGNILVIYVIVTRERMRTVTNMLLLNLAVSDLTFISFVPPVTAYQLAATHWPFGDYACRWSRFVVNVTAYVAIYTLVLISVVRYMTIVHSTRTARIRTQRNVLISIIVLWLGFMALNSPVFSIYGTKKFRRPFKRTECTVLDLDGARLVTVTFFIFAYVVPLAVIASFSSSIICHINQQQSNCTSQGTASGRSDSRPFKRTARKKRRVLRLLLLVVTMFALLMLPINIHLLVGFITCPSLHVTRLSKALILLWHCMMYANSVVNPFIYHHASNDFRDGFRDVIDKACCKLRRGLVPTSGISVRQRVQRTTGDIRGDESLDDDADDVGESRGQRTNLTDGLLVQVTSRDVIAVGCLSIGDRHTELETLNDLPTCSTTV